MAKEKEFDFTGANETSEEVPEEETPKEELSLEEQLAEAKIDKEIAEEETEKVKKQTAEQGKVTAEIIAEARKLAETPKGLNIDKFFQKHKLIGVDIEQLLQAPLKKDGTYA